MRRSNRRTRLKADLQEGPSMLRCGPSDRTLAATAKSDDGLIHMINEQSLLSDTACQC
jgi:hypothetical protein